MDQDPRIKQSSQEIPQDELKEGLLSGLIVPEDFLEKVDALDQAHLDRREAAANLRLLLNRDVQKYFTEGDLASNYQLKLSLTYFHIGQEAAINGSPQAVEYFEKSLEAFGKCEWDDNKEDPYLEATIAYLKKDTARVRQALPKVTGEKNKTIVERFLKRLEAGKEINYKVDYFGIRD